MKKTIKEYMAEKVAEAAKSKSKNQVPGGSTPIATETEDSKNREINKNFFLSLANKDFQGMSTAQKNIREQYKAKAQTIGGGTNGDEGGVLVPITVDTNIQTELEYISPIRQIARVISNAPAILRLPNASGGQAYWVEEAEDITDTAVTFATKELKPHKLASMVPGITAEFLQDVAVNPSALALLEKMLATKAALVENAAFTSGDGTDRPYGFRSSAVTPYSVDQAGATLDWTDFVSVQFKLPTAYRAQGSYVLPSAVLQKVISMKDEAGRPLFIPTVKDGVPGTILGRPVVIVDEIPSNLGSGTNESEIWYGVFSDYVIGDRLGTTFDLALDDGDFRKVQQSLRMVKRVGGVPTSNHFAVLRKVK